MGPGGRIILIGSVNRRGSVHALTKAAVAGFTRGLVRGLGARGITVNNIQPGPAGAGMKPASGPFSGTLKSYPAVNRYGRAEEIAGRVSYVSGPETAYRAGAHMKIDGGFTSRAGFL
jgi:3-oxoacyl-[acyl-carrier protein] reductase